MIEEKKKLSKKIRNKLIIRSLVACAVLLAVNTYAWFTFITNTDTDINATVVSWDISFMDNEDLFKELHLNIEDMYPGMPTFTKTIQIKNHSDFDTNFEANLESFTLLGNTYNVPTNLATSNDAINRLHNDYPFIVTFTPITNLLGPKNEMDFEISIEWPYENNTSYYKINEDFDYSNKYLFYTKVGNTYTNTTVIDTSFPFLRDEGLYVESDDADSYYGKKCGDFQKGGSSCLSINLKLKVSQAETTDEDTN